MLKRFKNHEVGQLFLWAVFLFLVLKFILLSLVFFTVDHRNFYNVLVHCYQHMDSYFYLEIAQYGYLGPDPTHPYQLLNSSHVYYNGFVFFPLYPLMIALVHHVFHLSYELSGFLIAQIACILALYFLGLLVRREFSFSLAKYVMLIFILFPTSFFLVSIYTESLFLTFALSGIYAASCRRFYWAGCLILAASFTRNTGLFLELILWAYYFHYQGFELQFWKKSFWLRHQQIFSLFITPIGILLYMAWLYVHFGDAFLFIHLQSSQWLRHFSPIWDTYYQVGYEVFFKAYSDTRYFSDFLNFIVINLLFVALVLGLKHCANSKIQWAWWFYLLIMVWISCTQPALNDYLFSLSRFSLMMFPAFVYWADVLQRSRYLFYLWLLLSFLLLLFYSWYFFCGGWVA